MGSGRLPACVMIDLSDVAAVRAALILLCRHPAKRITGRGLDEANRWRPYAVKDPDTLMWFTDDGAWNFIADCYQRNCPLLCKPPTGTFPDHSYVAVELGIYMKVAIRPPFPKIIGLSFHYEDPR